MDYLLFCFFMTFTHLQTSSGLPCDVPCVQNRSPSDGHFKIHPVLGHTGTASYSAYCKLNSTCQVVLGDHVRSLVLGMTQTYAQLKREVGGAIEV